MKSGILHVGLFTLLVGTVAILFSKAEKGRIERPGNLTQHTTAENFRFTNPNIVSTFNPEQFNSLKKEVLSYIDKKISEGKAQSVSVYYFNLRNESTIGISEHELYMPASLMKVLIMIAALKKSESDTAFLQKEARYEVAAYPDISPNVETENLIQLGKSYSLKELMRRMIVFSDNEAMDLLVKH
ncbi:MAG TPA: serine hydrolase, partial [Chitinophagales bacterium]|nr:serine hydrolase [Chitinophagales bacterium]